MSDIKFLLEELLVYALDRELLLPEDSFYARNALLDLLKLEEPYAETDALGQPCEAAFAAARALCPAECLSPAPILNGILDYAAEAGLIPENLTVYRDLFDARVMGLLMPRPSDFLAAYRRERAISPARGTGYFYRLSRASHYIMTERVGKNLYWKSATPYGDMEITVNLSKPEKDPREVAKLLTVKSASYPKCALCAENVGFSGSLTQAARQNLRQIPLSIQGEDWFLQYSPYVYYNEHCILLKGEHVPMLVSGKTFRRLFDFVDQFPHYFMGSNAGLPIVGGSILFHEHYQGGRHVFPMEKARRLAEYRHPDFPGVRIGRLHWPLTAYRLSGPDREELCRLADRLLSVWQRFDFPEAGIRSCDTDAAGVLIPHNTVTPIARKNAAGEYELDIVLRCNVTTDERPDGLFHAAPEYHHIKKENIGLIEVMGLAVLPGRLSRETELIRTLLCGERRPDELSGEEAASLEKHRAWIDRLTAAHGCTMDPAAADALLKAEVGTIFSKVLACCGVFKEDESGARAARAYEEQCGMEAL